MTYTKKFKIGDKVRIISKSVGDTLKNVQARDRKITNKNAFFTGVGWISRTQFDGIVDYVVSYDQDDLKTGDFYLESDLVIDEYIEGDLFDL